MDARKSYMRRIYSKYWITARENIYGFGEYDKSLCNYITERVPAGEKLFEVAIGTGYPIADFLRKAGYLVYGIDISSELLRKCQTINSNINCTIGDAEDLPCPGSVFGCTYCFHSTWYFPNLNRVIDEMMRVTRSPGLVIFDIQNRNAEKIAAAYHAKLAESTSTRKMMTYAKNIVKVMLHHGTPVWNPIVYEVPTFPESLYGHFDQIGITGFQVMARSNGGTLDLRAGKKPFKEDDRLIFVIEK